MLKLLVFFICLSIGSSIRCFVGTDRQCLLSPSTTDCGEGQVCQCAKYRFQCTADDQACTEEEKGKETIKWAYAIVGKSVCQMMKTAPGVYMNLDCCSTNKCNQPANGRCSFSQYRRRTMRHLASVIALD